MSSGDDKPPPAPDPTQLIALQNQYNRYNTSNPFGTSTWSTGENGHETLTQAPNEQMQGAIDRAFDLSAKPSEQMYIPQGMDQLASAILGRVGARYGLGGGNANNPTIGFGAQGGNSSPGGGGALNANLKEQYQPPPEIQNMGQGSMMQSRSRMGGM